MPTRALKRSDTDMGDQENFALALLDPERSPPAVLGHGGLKKRFDVYRNNVVFSLTEALASTYPVVRQVVGAEFFSAMARVFITLHPPVSPVLMVYGEAFPEFLADFEPVAALPYLPDLARLEFLQVESYHAADAQPLAAGVLGAVRPHDLADLRFEAHPATRLLVAGFAVGSIWLAHHDFLALDAVDPDTAESILVTRPRLEVNLAVLRPGQSAFIRDILSGAALGVAVETVLDTEPDFDVAGTLNTLLASGALSNLQP